MAGAMAVYYAVNGLFATWLQSEFQLTAAVIATPIMLANLAMLVASGFWGWIGDCIGRRRTIIIQALIACVVAPIYLLTSDLTWIVAGFVIQGCFGTVLTALSPAYMTERFPTEVRGTASGLC